MNLKYALLLSLVTALNACASVPVVSADTFNSSALLSVDSETMLNVPTHIRRNDFLAVMQVTPERLARVDKDKKIAINGAGYLMISKNDLFFPVKTQKFGTLYCGFTNFHRNALKTLLAQACMSDSNNDGRFDRFLSRTGSLNKDISGFIYYDSEVTPLTVKSGEASLPYFLENATSEHIYQIAFRYKIMKKNKNIRTAVFDILTKKPNEDQWAKFSNRNPITVSFSTSNKTTLFTTPLFTAELSEPTNSAFNARLIFVAEKGAFGFKRSLENKNSDGYRPAYQTTGP